MSKFEYKEYQMGDQAKQAQQAMQNQQAAKPAEYKSQWKGEMNDLLQKYKSRGPFQYDINADAMYQQMVDRYMQQGKQAMMDTMGQAASLTGGYGNSYAQQVGQQTYQKYLQGANDMLPQFYNMALERYQMEGDNLLNQYQLLSDQEDTAYGRYMDALNNWLADRDYLAGRYDSERSFDYGVYEGDRDFDYSNWVDGRNFEYQQERDKEADRQWQEAFDYQKEQDALARAAASSKGGGGGGNSKKKESSWAPGISEKRNQSGLKGSSWDYTKNNIEQLARTGSDKLYGYVDSVVGDMSESQYNQTLSILKKYGK